MNKHTQGTWHVNGADDVWIGERICIYVGDENDARLIASAPSLLDALKQVTENPYREGTSLYEQVLDIGRAAIAKATGEQA